MRVVEKLRKQVRRGKRFAREIWWGDTLTRKRETIEVLIKKEIVEVKMWRFSGAQLFYQFVFNVDFLDLDADGFSQIEPRRG